MMKSLMVCLFCLLAGTASAQELSLRPELILPRADTLSVYVVTARDTTAIGTIVDDIMIIESGGRRVIRRAYHADDRIMGAKVDTLIDDAATLAPISHRSRSSRSLEFLDYDADRVSGWIRLANGDSVAVDVPVSGAIYNASSFDLVLRAAPLHESWKAAVPSFLPATRSAVALNAEVTGSEVIDGVATWRVQANFVGTPVTFWIAKETRAMKRQLMQVRPDLGILIAPFKRAAVPRHAT